VETQAHAGQAKVRFHCTNVGGDNFMVFARVQDRPTLKVLTNDSTGVMTMWKRIDVEYHQMQGASPLPTADIAAPFAKAFVQMDWMDPPIADDPKDFLGNNDALADATATEYVRKEAPGTQRHFRNEGKPGWFLAVAALQFSRSEAGTHPVEIYDRLGHLQNGNREQTLIIDDPLSSTTLIQEITFEDAAQNQSVRWFLRSQNSIEVDTPHGQATLHLEEIDFHPQFPIDDPKQPAKVKGDLATVNGPTDNYFPGATFFASAPTNAQAPGYGFPSDTQITIYDTGGQVEGLSPPNAQGGRNFFAGRTIIFTRHKDTLKRARTTLTLAGTFHSDDVITVDIGGINVSVDAGGSEPQQVARRVAARLRADTQFAQKFRIRRLMQTTLEIANEDQGAAGNGTTIKVSIDVVAGNQLQATATLSSATLQGGGVDNFELASTMAHEFGHAFGFSHKCGYHSWEQGAEHSCCMNYFHTFMYKDPEHTDQGVQRFVTGIPSVHFCGRHLLGIRLVHLEDNDLLWKWPP
jgi:hypothetical protein